MVFASAKYLRNHVKELLSTVGNGEEVVVTYRGKAKAKLIPFPGKDTPSIENDQLFGIWKDNPLVKDVDNYIDKLRENRHVN